LTPPHRSALVAALACASLLAVTDCVAAKSAATKGGTNSSSAATANVAAKAAKHAVKKAASAKPKEKKSATGKTTAAAVPLPRARPDSSGAFAPARSAARGTSTGLPQPPAVPLAQTPTPQTSDPDVALVKSAIDSLRSGGADKATDVQATISDPVARKLVEWIILRSDRNGAGSARYAAFIAANPSWPSLAMFRRRAEALLWVENVKPAQVLGFFNGSPPQTAKGRLVLARALHAQGDTEGASALVREAWRNDPLPEEVEKQVLERWSEILSRADHKARIEKRLFAADNESAMRAARRLGGPTLQSRKRVSRSTARAAMPRSCSTPCRRKHVTMLVISSRRCTFCATTVRSPKPRK
jgi:soluble lytic murein transglycosylase